MSTLSIQIRIALVFEIPSQKIHFGKPSRLHNSDPATRTWITPLIFVQTQNYIYASEHVCTSFPLVDTEASHELCLKVSQPRPCHQKLWVFEGVLLAARQLMPFCRYFNHKGKCEEDFTRWCIHVIVCIHTIWILSINEHGARRSQNISRATQSCYTLIRFRHTSMLPDHFAPTTRRKYFLQGVGKTHWEEKME